MKQFPVEKRGKNRKKDNQYRVTAMWFEVVVLVLVVVVVVVVVVAVVVVAQNEEKRVTI